MKSMNITKTLFKCNSFSTKRGVKECFFTGISTPALPLKEALEELASNYLAALQDYGLDLTTQQFVRVFISDISNDEAAFLDSELYSIVSKSSFSIIEQGPLGGESEVGILAYHLKSDKFKPEVLSYTNHYNNQVVLSKGKNYSLLWTTNFISQFKELDAYRQTEDIFVTLDNCLKNYNMSIRNNTIRTWVFVRDVDNHYKGMVKARKDYFEKIGLTSKTRYIASTGIEGKSVKPETLITLDALSIGNIKEEQIERMRALSNLSDTIVYGVTFERGFRIRYGDRSHLYISGTASIDSAGNTIYISDVRKQTERTLDNIEALLAPHQATLSDMQYLILYLRNIKHWLQIQDILMTRIPENVLIMPVEAPVCRPNWLIEIEGVGIIPDSTEYPPFE